MTVEIRTEEGGRSRQCPVGRQADTHTGEPSVVIPWDEFKVKVYEDEVFDAETAADVFTTSNTIRCRLS